MDERKTSRLRDAILLWLTTFDAYRSHETKTLEKNFAANKILSGKTE